MIMERRSPAMTNAATLVHHSATELQHLLQTKTISVVELTQAFLQQIDQNNPKINAVITVDAEGALAQAQQADRAIAHGECLNALHGLPMTVKDVFVTAGMRTTFGDPATDQFVPSQDAVLVQRLRQAGAIILGKTNVPYQSYDWQCNHPTAGRTNNPWDITRTPGGSSGGSAAALAAGFTSLEIGSDVAGSIRLPAHFCGLWGLRPTENLLPTAGHLAMPNQPDTVRNFVTVGPLAKTLPDLQLLFSTLRSPTSPRQQTDLAPSTKPLKIAWTEQLGDIPIDSEQRSICHHFLEQLRRAGHHVEARPIPEINWAELLDLWGEIQGCELSVHLPNPIKHTPLRQILPAIYWQHRLGKSQLAAALGRGMKRSVEQYLVFLERRDRLMEIFDQFLSQWDGWLCPVAPVAAITHCPVGTPIVINDCPYPYADTFGYYLATTTIPAHPIVTFPVGQLPTGLPIGIQLHGRRWQDEKTLAIAAQLSQCVAA